VFISRLRLVNFRSYRDVAVDFAPGLNVIVGRNASGKTNLLEGAWFALRASSPRTSREEKAVRWGAGFARAEAVVVREAASAGPASRTTTVGYAPGQGKQVRIDGVEVQSLDDLRRQGSAFIFVPESLLLVKGSPARRRAHLDVFGSSIDPGYAAGLRDLTAVLKQRNAQMLRVREGAGADTLDVWDVQLARVSLAFETRRRGLVARLAEHFAHFARGLTVEQAEFSLSLVTQLDGLTAGEEPFVAALRARRAGEIARAVSGFGPHRDDLRFAEVVAASGEASAESDAARASVEQGPGALRDLRLFGSQGEQRAAVLALLLAERAVAADLTGELGPLLLDDVMSELDDTRRRLLVAALSSSGQAIVTTTNRHYFTADELDRALVLQIGPEGPVPEGPLPDGSSRLSSASERADDVAAEAGDESAADDG